MVRVKEGQTVLEGIPSATEAVILYYLQSDVDHNNNFLTAQGELRFD